MALGETSAPVPAVVGRQTSGSFTSAQMIDAKNFAAVCFPSRQRGDEFGHVNRAAAADAKHAVNFCARAELQDRFKHLTRRLAVHRRRGHDFDARFFQRRRHFTERRQHRRAGNKQHALDAALRKEFGALRRAAVAENDARRLEQSNRCSWIRLHGRRRNDFFHAQRFPSFKPAQKRPFLFQIRFRRKQEARKISDDEDDEVADDADHHARPGVIVFAKINHRAFAARQNRPGGENQVGDDSNPKSLPVGAEAEEREQKHSCQSAGNNCRGRIIKLQCTFAFARDEHGDAHGNHAANGDDNFPREQPLPVGGDPAATGGNNPPRRRRKGSSNPTTSWTSRRNKAPP